MLKIFVLVDVLEMILHAYAYMYYVAIQHYEIVVLVIRYLY